MSLPSLPPRGEFTVATLDLLPLDGNRYEVIDGDLYVLVPYDSAHEHVVNALRLLMEAYAESVGLTLQERHGRIQFAEQRMVFPDLAFTRLCDGNITNPPVLIVEVASRWTRNADWNVKPELYASEGVAEYWIVDRDKRHVIVRRHGSEQSTISRDILFWQPSSRHTPLELRLDTVFASAKTLSTSPPDELCVETVRESRADTTGRLREWDVRMLDVTPDDGCRYEVFDGTLSITPVPPLIHQLVLGHLMLPLFRYSESRGLDFIMGPIGVDFSANTQVQPDMVVYETRFSGDDADQRRMQETPILIVEILAPHTIQLDRVVKRSLYQRAGVLEYWIVDVETRVVERWLPTSSVAEVFRETLEWQPLATHDALVLDLVMLFRRVYGD